MARNIAYGHPERESYIFYPDTNWAPIFFSDNPMNFEDKHGVTQIDERMFFVYQAITTADAMKLELVGKGSKYLGAYKDSDGKYLMGSNTYHLNIPANVPAENFWSAMVL